MATRSRRQLGDSWRDWCAEVMTSPEVRARLATDAAAGELPPQMMTRMLDDAFGRPANVVQLNVTESADADVSNLTDDELRDQIMALQSQLTERATGVTH